MNLIDLQAIASASGIPLSLIILTWAGWHVFGKWFRDEYLPRLAEAREKQAAAMDAIGSIMESLQHELRENRRISNENNDRLTRMDVKLDQLAGGRAANGRARKVGEP